ncbi:hypothetical protein AUJ17_03240 [Candidatus Micrarchaeota archaeon CG1_02_47_40]|nr:MAG: hypothetical protein AUJ17_03240 [Candidatus Micrarchaeota archaeon CG1_02_47_40]
MVPIPNQITKEKENGDNPVPAKRNGKKQADGARCFPNLPPQTDRLPVGKTATQLCEEALELLRKGRHNEAIEKAKEAKRREPENPKAFNISGICLHHRGESNEKNGWLERAKEDYGKAVSDYSKAIKSDPKNPGFYSNRGHVYKKLAEFAQKAGQTEEAEELLANAKSDRETAGKLTAKIGKTMNSPKPS